MLKNEKRYDFRKELMEIHKPNRRNEVLKPCDNEVELTDGLLIITPEEENAVSYTAAKDFADYLYVSMNVGAAVCKKSFGKGFEIRLEINQDIEEASGYMGFKITTQENGILIEGYDHRGLAQALYSLEDVMNIRKAPFIERGTVKRKALFSPRITHSPMGFHNYTDEALSLISHYGMDAIQVWIRDAETDFRGNYFDLRLLCERAEKYGIDVYAEVNVPHSVSPHEEGAEAFYDGIYGELFDKCPKLKGLILIGEAMQFKSRDPRVGDPSLSSSDGIPSMKPNPGWYPCIDYPQMVEIVQRAVYKCRPDVDIVLVTYNWGCVEEKERLRLIEDLPSGVSLMPTWDGFQRYKVGNVCEMIKDYTLSRTSPGDYFVSEAKAAQKKGIKLYANAQASGRTWDFGVVPYEPMPYQWIKKYNEMVEAHEKWNLCGLVENIHYSFHPSFITDLEKQAFFSGGKSLDEVLKDLLVRDFGEENYNSVDNALKLWSEAITHYHATSEDQYGGFRVGPSYPLWSSDNNSGKYKGPKHAVFGNCIFGSHYSQSYSDASFPSVRLYKEIEEFEIMAKLMLEGIEILETIENPCDRLLKLTNLGKFIYRTVLTVLNVKKHFIIKRKLSIAETHEECARLLDAMEEILLAEKANVEATIPIVNVDSRLGWEPTMEYTTDEDALRWKLRQLDYELNNRFPLYRKGTDQRDIIGKNGED